MFHFADIQRAVYEALRDDATVAALVGGRVFDEADHNAAFPYITIGESTTTPDDALGVYGALAAVTVHGWSRAAGMAELQAIMRAVFEVLDDRRYPLPASQWVECRCDLGQTLRDLDGQTRHGILRFRVRTFDVAPAMAGRGLEV